LNTVTPLEKRAERDLRILEAVAEDRSLTQRALAKRLGVALGLANLYIRRLANKGLIKITDFPRKPSARKRLRYVLTPRGLAEKTRLTYEYMSYSLAIYRRTRNTLRDALSRTNGMKKIALCGVGDAAELAYLTLKEFGLEPHGVFADGGGIRFLGFEVRSVTELTPKEFDGVVIATFERPEPHLARLSSQGFAPEQLLTIRRPMTSRSQRDVT